MHNIACQWAGEGEGGDACVRVVVGRRRWEEYDTVYLRSAYLPAATQPRLAT